ncbi:MAG TPA: nuclear transport factor 2 family protein [Chitinophagaceae bacterium]|nr:nuclear transport factor 2 family protein [Chitinophagaceae bacterium]
MKRVLFIFATISFVSCNQGTKQEAAASKDTTSNAVTAAPAINYSYPTLYSHAFVIGNPQYAETILKAWKAWDNGDLSAAKDLFADTVSMYFRTGMTIHGSRDTVIAMSQQGRNMFTKVQSTVDAFVPLRATDRNEDWVCIWGTEVNTDKKGHTDSTRLQETWRFNKDGKIDLLYQFGAVAAPPAKK